MRQPLSKPFVKTSLLAIGLTTFITASAQSDEQDIRTLFQEFRAATFDQDGETVVELATSNSLEYYDRIKELALNAPETAVRNLPVIDQYNVLIFRHVLSYEELDAGTAEQILQWYVDEGWLTAGPYARFSLGGITISGGKATGQAVVRDQPQPMSYHFAQEGGAWKIDLEAMHGYGARTFADQAQRNGITPDQLALIIIERHSERPVQDVVWHPLRQ